MLLLLYQTVLLPGAAFNGQKRDLWPSLSATHLSALKMKSNVSVLAYRVDNLLSQLDPLLLTDGQFLKKPPSASAAS